MNPINFPLMPLQNLPPNRLAIRDEALQNFVLEDPENIAAYAEAGSLLVAANRGNRLGPCLTPDGDLYPQLDMDSELDFMQRESPKATLRLFWTYLESLLGLNGADEPKLFTKNRNALKAATRDLKFGYELLDMPPATSTEDLVTKIRTQLDDTGAVLIPLSGQRGRARDGDRKELSMFLYISEKGITLFQADTIDQPHPDIVEQSLEPLGKKRQLTKIKHQEVLFIKKFDRTILAGDKCDELLTTLLNIAQRGLNENGRKWIYNTLPGTVDGRWESPERSSLYYKMQRLEVSPPHVTADLFYYLLLDQIDSPEEARRAYKLVRYCQKRDQQLSNCSQLIDSLKQTPADQIAEPRAQTEITTLRAINLHQLSDTALKLKNSGDITDEELQRISATVTHASFYQKQLVRPWISPEVAGPWPERDPFEQNPRRTIQNNPHNVDGYAVLHEVAAYTSSTSSNPQRRSDHPTTKTPLLDAKLPAPLPPLLFSNPLALLDDLQSIYNTLLREAGRQGPIPTHLCEALIKQIPSLSLTTDYWNQVVNGLQIQPNELLENHDKRIEALFSTLFDILSLLRTAQKELRYDSSTWDIIQANRNTRDHFAPKMLQWTLYGTAQLLVQKRHNRNLFDKNPFELTGFTAFATSYRNFTLDRDISQKFEELVSLISPTTAPHDPELFNVVAKEPKRWSTSTIDLKKEKPTLAPTLFFKQFIDSSEEADSFSVLEASAQPDRRLDPFNLPQDAKLLQQIIWLLEISKYSDIKLWQYRYKPDEKGTKDSWGTFFSTQVIDIIDGEWTIRNHPEAIDLVKNGLSKTTSDLLQPLVAAAREDAATFTALAEQFIREAEAKVAEAKALEVGEIARLKAEEAPLKSSYEDAVKVLTEKQAERSRARDLLEKKQYSLRNSPDGVREWYAERETQVRLQSEQEQTAFTAACDAVQTAQEASNRVWRPYHQKTRERSQVEQAAANLYTAAEGLKTIAKTVENDQKTLKKKADQLKQASAKLKALSETPRSTSQLLMPIGSVMKIISTMHEIQSWDKSCVATRRTLISLLATLREILRRIETTDRLNPQRIRIDSYRGTIRTLITDLQNEQKFLNFAPQYWEQLGNVPNATKIGFSTNSEQPINAEERTDANSYLPTWAAPQELLNSAAIRAMAPTKESTITQQIQYHDGLSDDRANLMRTVANPRDDINRMIGYHMDNPRDPQDPLFQPWIFFAPGILEGQLRDNPEFISLFSTYFNTIFAAHLANHHVIDAVHLIQLGLFIKRYVKEINPQLANGLPSFFDFTLKLEEECKAKMLSAQEIAAVQFVKFSAICIETPDRLNQFGDNPEGDPDLVATFIAGNLNRLPNTPYVEELITLRTKESEVLRAYLLNTLFHTQETRQRGYGHNSSTYHWSTPRLQRIRDDILNLVTQFFGETVQANPPKWETFEAEYDSLNTSSEKSVYCASTVGTYNLKSGELRIRKNQVKERILNRLVGEGHLAKLLGVKKIEKGQEGLDGWTTLRCNDEERYGIFIEDSAFTLRRQDLGNEETYTLITDTNQLSTFGALKEFLPEVENSGVLLWAASTIDFYIEFADREPQLFSLETLPLDDRAVMPILTQWIKASGFELKSHTENEEDRLTQFTLVKGTIRIACLVGNIGGLSRATTSQYPGYYLTPYKLPGLPAQQLVLENGPQGDKKLLIPVEYNGESEGEKIYELRLFDLPKGSTNWKPVTLADKLLYATFLARMGQIEEAHQILVQISLLKPLSIAEKHHLTELAQVTAQDPVASQFIALKAAILVMEDILKYPPLGGQEQFSAEISKLARIAVPVALPHYLTYLQTEMHLRGKSLTELQEIVLLKFLTRLFIDSQIDQLPEEMRERIKYWRPFVQPLLDPIRSVEFEGAPIPAAAPLLAIPHLNRRLEALEAGDVSVGNSVRTPYAISTPVPLPTLSGDDLYGAIRGYNELRIGEKAAAENGVRMLIDSSPSWIREGLFNGDFSIGRQFATYYKIIKSANSEELAKLKRIYDTTSDMFPDAINNGSVATFGELLKNPSAYPSFETLIERIPAIDELNELAQGWRDEDTILQGLKLWYYERDLKPKDKTIFQQLQLWHYTRSMKRFAALNEAQFFKRVKAWDSTTTLEAVLDGNLPINSNFVHYYVLATEHPEDADFIAELKRHQIAVADENRNDPHIKLLGEVLENPSAYPTITSLQETVQKLETLRYNPFDLIGANQFFQRVQGWQDDRKYVQTSRFRPFTQINTATNAANFLAAHPINAENIPHYYALATSSKYEYATLDARPLYTSPLQRQEQLAKLVEIQQLAATEDPDSQHVKFLGELLEKPTAFAAIEDLKYSSHRVEEIRAEQENNRYPGLLVWEEAKRFYLKLPFYWFTLLQSIATVALPWIRFAGKVIGIGFNVLVDRAAIYFAHSVVHLKEALKPATTTMLSFSAKELKREEAIYVWSHQAEFQKLIRTKDKSSEFDQQPFTSGEDLSPRLRRDLDHLNEYIDESSKKEYEPGRNAINETLKNWETKWLDPSIIADRTALRQLQEGVTAETLEDWKKEFLETRIVAERAALKIEEQKLLDAAAHRLRKKSAEEMLLEAQTPDANMHTLYALFLKGSLEAFKEKTTLTDDEIQALFNDMALFFRQKSCLNQLETISDNLTRYLECGDEDEAQILFETFARSLEQRRQYSLTADNRAKLLFEAVQGIMLRKLQVEKIGLILETLLNEGQKTLFEMSTGLGKTKAIAPVSNLETSDGTHLVVNIFPRALTIINTIDNATTLEKAGRTADSKVFHRATFMSRDVLDYHYRKMLSDIENRIPLDGYSETFRSMELHLLSLLMNGTEKPLDEESEACAELLRKMMQLLRKKGFANIDEARDNLNPFDRLIYTRRQRDQLKDYELDVVENLFTAFFDGFEGEDILKRVKDNTLPDIAHDYYLSTIAPKLAERMVESLLIGQNKNKSDEENLAEQKLFIDYVLGKTNLYGKDDKTTRKWLEAHEKKDAICLVRGFLLVILPDVMKGYVNQNYGFSKKHRENSEGESKKGFAIPYLSANTPKETEFSPSEFQNQHETAGKTLIALFHEGLSERQLQELLDDLIESYNEDKEDAKSDSENGSYITLRKIFMIEKGEALNVSELSKNFIGENYEKVRYNRDTIFYYFRKIVALQISLYKQTFVSTSFDFLKQFASSTSMTATPQEAGAHGKDTIFIPTPGSKGYIPYHFFAKGNDIASINTENYKTLVEGVGRQLFQREREKNALIDVGGLFRGHNNREVVDSLFAQLEHFGSDLTHIAYFDEQKEEFVVVGKDSKTEMIYLKDFKGDLSKLLIYFDKARTVGSDTKLGATAEALTLIGPHTTQSEMGQGIGRMRQLQYGQSTTFALPQKLYNELYAVSKEAVEFTLQQKKELLYRHLSIQEEDLEGRGNLLAVKQQINAEIRNIVLEKICSASTIAEAQEIFEKDKGELVTTAHFEPSKLYGSIVAEEDVDKDLNRFLERAQERVKNLHCQNFFAKRKVVNMLEGYKALWEDGDKKLTLPEKTISTEEEINGECDVLVEQEVEQQVEQQIHREVEHERLEPRPLSPWLDKVDLFTPGWEKIEAVGIPLLQKTVIYRLWLRFERRFPKLAVVVKIGTMVGIVAGLSLVAWQAAAVAGAIFAMWALYKVGRRIYDHFNPPATPPLFRAQDLAQLELGGVAGKLFDNEDLLLTNNYSNQKPVSGLFEAQPLFTAEQKPGYQLLFLVDEEMDLTVTEEEESESVASENGEDDDLSSLDGENISTKPPKEVKEPAPKVFRKVQAVLVDQNDSTFLRKIFSRDELPSGEHALPRQRHAVLYDLQTNIIVAQGKNELTKEELQGLPHFYSYTAQAKFFDRQFNQLLPEELTILKDKTALISAKEMQSLVTKMLKDKPETQKRFRASLFGKHLKEQLKGISA